MKKSLTGSRPVFWVASLAFLLLALACSSCGKSRSQELLGVEAQFKTIYRTDTSDRGREAGAYVVVYELPEDTQELLDANKIDLTQYPMPWGDRFKCMNWAKGSPRNDAEKQIIERIKQDETDTAMPVTKEIVDDESAELAAIHLLKLPGTMCGGWYREGLTDYYYYVLNVEKRMLIMFGLQT